MSHHLQSDAPVILSMEVCSKDDSEYRILIHGRVRYLTIARGTYDRSTLSMPLSSLPDLPKSDAWNRAHIRRDSSTGELEAKVWNETLPGVQDIWHPESFDCLDLKRVKQITAATFEATLSRHGLSASSTPMLTVIAKIARFQWEIPRLSQETRTYKSLENTGLAPRFLGHIHEHGRVIGILLEKLEGHEANIEDLSACVSVLKKLHSIGILHGDVNRYNFIIQNDTARLIDFERSRICHGDTAPLDVEMASLNDQLNEDTGRGGGFLFKQE
ncbi:hypothetical protein BDV32DRAFT_160991 [Aspergillus pseudonomiae]|uniref:Uncharacterized protein n=1 Tax=Aspergillus pseudonomiae TaxID=1506151 RepID=A0A5N7DGR0_9EURO|nr:uncharacterized protein BDV37DRAFT_293053 [Aspergillus pseudonomiae]KAB8264181.1 hypothetical protein BDV32DRAFT_160991 [Aspergillus pseudonomiae]KAE8405600.1 hypothetical protein BDV37DRAFT_293053 [Aspergillus pseudonomiae]